MNWGCRPDLTLSRNDFWDTRFSWWQQGPSVSPSNLRICLTLAVLVSFSRSSLRQMIPFEVSISSDLLEWKAPKGQQCWLPSRRQKLWILTTHWVQARSKPIERTLHGQSRPARAQATCWRSNRRSLFGSSVFLAAQGCALLFEVIVLASLCTCPPSCLLLYTLGRSASSLMPPQTWLLASHRWIMGSSHGSHSTF